jgi:hypothetical protein
MSTCLNCVGTKNHQSLVGKKFKRPDGHIVKVMAVVDNYVMARVPRCMPFVMGGKEFIKHFMLQE